MEEVENSVCVTDPPEMMQFLLWTTGSVFGIVYILLGKQWHIDCMITSFVHLDSLDSNAPHTHHMSIDTPPQIRIIEMISILMLWSPNMIRIVRSPCRLQISSYRGVSQRFGRRIWMHIVDTKTGHSHVRRPNGLG